MRIDLNTGTVSADSKLEKRPGASSTRSTPSDGVASEAHFSAGQASVSALAASAMSAPEVRAAKIEALRAQIASGQYLVSSQQLAASVLAEMRAAS